MATRAKEILQADRTGAVSSAKSRASEEAAVKAKPLAEERPATRSRPPAKATPVARSQPLAKSQPLSKTRHTEPATNRGDDSFIAEARRKVDALSAEVAAQEKKHKADRARFERERQDLERRIEELENVERRFETPKRHLDIAEARRKVDAMSAEVAAQEKKHKADLARFERERQDLERKIEELKNVERRFETLKRHLDGSLTWRLGGGLRSALRAWRKLGRPASKGA